MEVNSDICRERLLNRRYNIVTGSKHNLSSTITGNDDVKLGVHPKDFRLNVERDVKYESNLISKSINLCIIITIIMLLKIQEYEENVIDMMEYAGESAIKIDGNDEERIVREKVEASIMHPILSWQSRIPRPPPKIDPMSIEFDPDDEPDSSVFDKIRAPEPKYTFI